MSEACLLVGLATEQPGGKLSCHCGVQMQHIVSRTNHGSFRKESSGLLLWG